ncbi:selection and upkeep of intraepithelial T-cells protein 8-like [Oreochromis niloticus]|uniref:selection and upkeep of intraepithelial T-cells protein 8-like n=1 Tax=Oreochromis niloticus TaxID=8128 RepID=UPI000DF2DB94|nr:selection and upkeep of intraepithelial T-cells protein 8-like [Oreochromis niloticus]XP_039464160.1 selection and upkeep of intraepithelial T-cells protein 8-like [Oreochromis aureus]
MAAGPCASLCSTLLFIGVFAFVSADQKIITAESGQDVTLTCRAPNNNFIVVEWSRADLGDEYVFVYRDGRFVPDSQHPSFKNRVDLQDRQMKDGDVSLVLKNVTTADDGSYNCNIFNGGTTSWESINTVSLTVSGQTEGQEKDEDNKDGGKEDKEKEDGSAGLTVGLSVPAVLLVAVVVGFLIYKGCKQNPADPHEAEHLQPDYQKTIPAESGQDVTLTCRAVNNESEKMNQQLHQPEVDPTQTQTFLSV